LVAPAASSGVSASGRCCPSIALASKLLSVSGFLVCLTRKSGFTGVY
jgi:hypothetical protein